MGAFAQTHAPAVLGRNSGNTEWRLGESILPFHFSPIQAEISRAFHGLYRWKAILRPVNERFEKICSLLCI